MPSLEPNERARLERNIGAFYAFKILIGLQFLIPIWVLYLTEKRGLSLEQVTLLDAPFWLALVVMEVPTGVIADRYGRRLSLLLGTLANTTGVVIFAMAADFPVILASYLVWGAAFTLYSGADNAFLFDTLRALGRDHDFGKILGRALALTAAAGLVATLIGPPLAAATDLTVPIYASAAMTMLALLVVITRMQEPPRFDTGEKALPYLQSVRVAFRTIWSSPDLKRFVPMVAAGFAAMMTVFVFGQPFLDRHGVATGNVGWFLVFSQAAGIPAALIAHRMPRKLGWRTSFLFLPIAAGCVLAVLWRFDALWVFPAIPIAAFVLALYQPMAADYINQRIGSAQRATVLSFQSLLVSLILAPLEVMAGVVADRRGLPLGFGVVAVFVIAVSLPFLLAWLRTTQDAVIVEEPLAAIP